MILCCSFLTLYSIRSFTQELFAIYLVIIGYSSILVSILDGGFFAENMHKRYHGINQYFNRLNRKYYLLTSIILTVSVIIFACYISSIGPNLNYSKIFPLIFLSFFIALPQLVVMRRKIVLMRLNKYNQSFIVAEVLPQTIRLILVTLLIQTSVKSNYIALLFCCVSCSFAQIPSLLLFNASFNNISTLNNVKHQALPTLPTYSSSNHFLSIFSGFFNNFVSLIAAFVPSSIELIYAMCGRFSTLISSLNSRFSYRLHLILSEKSIIYYLRSIILRFFLQSFLFWIALSTYMSLIDLGVSNVVYTSYLMSLMVVSPVFLGLFAQFLQATVGVKVSFIPQIFSFFVLGLVTYLLRLSN